MEGGLLELARAVDMTNYMDYCMIMIKLNIHEIKAGFSRYIELVEAGDTVLVCKRNTPVAEIRPLEKKKLRKPVLGSAKGLIRIASDFDEPLSDQDLQSWYGIADDDPLKKFAPKSQKR
jgi:antitoxin (DNA-binding transcriptional repressor) of toxin-antitoxin stability system